MKKQRIQMRIYHKDDHSQVFKMIIHHPMENGKRKNRKTGEYIPANYIAALHISVDGEKLIDYSLSQNISRSPYFSFVLTQPVVDGQKIQLHWLDNHNIEMNFEVVVKFNKEGRFNYRNYKQKARAKPRPVQKIKPRIKPKVERKPNIVLKPEYRKSQWTIEFQPIDPSKRPRIIKHTPPKDTKPMAESGNNKRTE